MNLPWCKCLCFLFDSVRSFCSCLTKASNICYNPRQIHYSWPSILLYYFYWKRKHKRKTKKRITRILFQLYICVICLYDNKKSGTKNAKWNNQRMLLVWLLCYTWAPSCNLQIQMRNCQARDLSQGRNPDAESAKLAITKSFRPVSQTSQNWSRQLWGSMASVPRPGALSFDPLFWSSCQLVT
jgi:hypothetical protein